MILDNYMSYLPSQMSDKDIQNEITIRHFIRKKNYVYDNEFYGKIKDTIDIALYKDLFRKSLQ